MLKRVKLLLASAACALVIGQPAFAADEPIKIAGIYDLSKVYTFISPQIAQGATDYINLINSKGGVEGHPVVYTVGDHGNEPQRGIEGYEKFKREGYVLFDFLSSPVSRAVLPRAMKDGNPMLQTFVGRADAVDGDVFNWIFPMAPTYWGQAANIVKFIEDQAGGDAKGKKVAFLYLDYAFGQEPIPILKALAEKKGFDLQLFPYPLPCTDQASAWTGIRRYKPDWVVHWSFAGLHVIASKQMKRNKIPMSKFISVNWINEVDLKNIGHERAKGLKRSEPVVAGREPVIIQEILNELYAKGKGSGDVDNVGATYYNTGVAIYAIALEGMRNAIKSGASFPLTPAAVKAGMESIQGFDVHGLMPPVNLSSSNHGGDGKTRISEWDGEKWVPLTDWFVAESDLVWQEVKKHSAEYVKSGK